MALKPIQLAYDKEVKAAARRVAANAAANEASKKKFELQAKAARGVVLSTADLKFAYGPALDARGQVRTR